MFKKTCLIVIIILAILPNVGLTAIIEDLDRTVNPPEILSQPLNSFIYAAILQAPPFTSAKQEIIGIIERPFDFQQNARAFAESSQERRQFMNAFGISGTAAAKRAQALPKKCPVIAFIFSGTGKTKDPALIIVGGVHGNELSSVNSALWLAERLQDNGDLTFLRNHFSKIAVIPQYSPYGCALGLRIGENGKDPTFFTKWWPAEKTILRDFLQKLSQGKNEVVVIDYHEKNKNDRTALLLTGLKSFGELRAIGVSWAHTMKELGFLPAQKEEFGIANYVEGCFWIPSMAPEIIGLDYKIQATVEAGAKEFSARPKEHHIATLVALNIIINLTQGGY